MGLLDRFRQKPLPPGPTLAEVEDRVRSFVEARLSELSGREIDYHALDRLQQQTSEYLDRTLPPTLYTVRESLPSPFDYKDEPRLVKRNAKRLEQGRAALAVFVAANPDLGLITRTELDSANGDALVAWAGERLGIDVGNHNTVRRLPEAEREALKERILTEGLRWEEVAADERDKGYSLTREYAFRAGGIASLGVVWTHAYKTHDEDVLRTVARTRLERSLAEEIKQRVAEHNRALANRPVLDASEARPGAERPGPGFNLEL